MQRALFICSKNRLRSPTAEQIFAGRPNVEVDSAGLAADANIRVSSDHIAWATIIFVMEPKHRWQQGRVVMAAGTVGDSTRVDAQRVI